MGTKWHGGGRLNSAILRIFVEPRNGKEREFEKERNKKRDLKIGHEV